MTGPYHYGMAGHYLEEAESFYCDGDFQRAEYRIRLAHAHATLALAAATALLGPVAAIANPSDPELKAWRVVVEPQDGAQ